MMLESYFRAGFPCVAVSTVEEVRFTRSVVDSFADIDVWRIAAVGGVVDVRADGVIDATAQYAKAFGMLATREDTILIVLDFQHIIANAGAYRALKDHFPALKARGSMIVLVAPSWHLPAELEHDVPVLDFDLPTREQLAAALDTIVTSTEDGHEFDRAGVLDAASGLTLQEAENAFALTYVEREGFDAQRVLDEKMKLVRQSGYLEVTPPAPIALVGGLEQLKEYLRSELLPAKDDPLLRVRGVLLVGVPGTGKSLAARATGALLGWPVLRCDMAGLKGSLVGQSEANMRSALKVADAVAPCVLYLDEVEKAVGGYASSAATDSGVTLGMVGTLLTWMQEHESSVVVVATCNDYQKLPPELTRAGRFDERFFVDLPITVERVDIAAVHLRRFDADVAMAPAVADLSDAWTGAEIEQLVKSAARRTHRSLTTKALNECARDIRPISRVRAAEIEALRSWARDALRTANTASIAATSSRRVRR